MTTGLFATWPMATGPALHWEMFRRGRTFMLPLLAILGIGLVVMLATRLDRAVAAPVARPDPAFFTPPVTKASLGRTKASVAVEALPEIDVLASLFAKRYRISAEATRGMVLTAYREGRRVGVDPLLIVAVISVESRFNPIAESDAGAQGLMQVIPGYHKDKLEAADVESVLDPHANIRLGARVLKDYIRRGGTEIAGLQRYNGATDDATNAYANKVLAERARLHQAVQRARDRVRA